jgi:hypothetical protein
MHALNCLHWVTKPFARHRNSFHWGLQMSLDQAREWVCEKEGEWVSERERDSFFNSVCVSHLLPVCEFYIESQFTARGGFLSEPLVKAIFLFRKKIVFFTNIFLHLTFGWIFFFFFFVSLIWKSSRVSEREREKSRPRSEVSSSIAI